MSFFKGCYGQQKYHGKTCSAYRVLKPQSHLSEETKEKAIKMYQERESLRGITRVFGVHHSSVAQWLKTPQSLPDLKNNLKPTRFRYCLDLWKTYSLALPPCFHRGVKKGVGKTNQLECFNNPPGSSSPGCPKKL